MARRQPRQPQQVYSCRFTYTCPVNDVEVTIDFDDLYIDTGRTPYSRRDDDYSTTISIDRCPSCGQSHLVMGD